MIFGMPSAALRALIGAAQLNLNVSWPTTIPSPSRTAYEEIRYARSSSAFPRFGGRERAVAEVGERDVETNDRFLRAAAIRTVAGDAGGPIDVFTGPRRRERPLRGQPRRRAADKHETEHDALRCHPGCLYQRKMRTG